MSDLGKGVGHWTDAAGVDVGMARLDIGEGLFHFTSGGILALGFPLAGKLDQRLRITVVEPRYGEALKILQIVFCDSHANPLLELYHGRSSETKRR
jgi:hypothetical protein